MSYLKEIVKKQKEGIKVGCFSACTANSFVIEAIMECALERNSYVIIEATANQVNQFGGYSGMTPKDFQDFVFDIAKKTSFPKEKIILGGDHLGPLVWKHEDEILAMNKAEELIRQFVLAGFTKIHIDTSMKLNGDESLSDETIAKRSAGLYKAAKESFIEYKKENPDAPNPVYIIGSEVPIPGGAQDEEEAIKVTSDEDFKNTVYTFEKVFGEMGLDLDDVVAVVVQPGVEFSDNAVFDYDRQKAKRLTEELKKYPNLVFEGHSTDYQTKYKLKEMVEDGIAILKVGPALTFALREALFGLANMEKELYINKPYIGLSNFKEVLENAMLDNPKNWENHYHGDRTHLSISRKYSYSDRCRYYLNDRNVKNSIDILIKNINTAKPSLNIISQYFQKQYDHLRARNIEITAEWLIKDRIKDLINDYYFAIGKGNL